MGLKMVLFQKFKLQKKKQNFKISQPFCTSRNLYSYFTLSRWIDWAISLRCTSSFKIPYFFCLTPYFWGQLWCHVGDKIKAGFCLKTPLKTGKNGLFWSFWQKIFGKTGVSSNSLGGTPLPLLGSSTPPGFWYHARYQNSCICVNLG